LLYEVVIVCVNESEALVTEAVTVDIVEGLAGEILMELALGIVARVIVPLAVAEPHVYDRPVVSVTEKLYDMVLDPSGS
jgi:hypothetical protein